MFMSRRLSCQQVEEDGGGVTARDHGSGLCLDIWNMKPLDIRYELSGCFAAMLVETEATTESTQRDNVEN